ncbi:MAG TPA: T9SS type A sorting domain-containing protein, partial [Candidatus Marinimicrobia bacterium]|nr:T9SS type A sorting domain-containing protein [Candidatus Neomarinimicrobiota bacterium]
RIIQDVINTTGHSIDSTSVQPEGGWPLLSSLPAPTDTDHDGMPDDWEIAHSLNPTDAADRNLLDENGYTRLENYLNDLVEQNPNRIVSKPNVVADFRLAQNYPNPFNATTTIQFSLFKTGLAEIRIYDLAGQVVKTYPRQSLMPGEYRLVWQGNNDAGKPVASGIYFCVMQFAENRQILKMQIIR